MSRTETDHWPLRTAFWGPSFRLLLGIGSDRIEPYIGHSVTGRTPTEDGVGVRACRLLWTTALLIYRGRVGKLKDVE